MVIISEGFIAFYILLLITNSVCKACMAVGTVKFAVLS